MFPIRNGAYLIEEVRHFPRMTIVVFRIMVTATGIAGASLAARRAARGRPRPQLSFRLSYSSWLSLRVYLGSKASHIQTYRKEPVVRRNRLRDRRFA